MAKEDNFEHESYQDRETIKNYLASLLHGFETGKIVMNSDKDNIELNVNSLIKFRVAARKKGDRNRVELVISWRDGKQKISQEKIFIGSQLE